MSYDQKSNSDQNQKIEKYAEQIFLAVKQQGAEADLIVNQTESLSLKANQGELEEHKISNLLILGLRVIKEGKVGSAYSEASDTNSLDNLVNQALINSAYATTDANETIEKMERPYSTLKTNNKFLCPDEQLDENKKISWIIQLEDKLLKKPKICAVPYNGFSETTHQQQIFSTQGLHAKTQNRSIGAYAYALAEEKQVRAMSGFGQAGRTYSNINISDLAETVYEETIAMLLGKNIPSKRYDVIFSSECLTQLISTFTLAVSGKAAKEGVNPWREKLGQTVADKRFSLSDQPLNTIGLGYAFFDSEGQPTRPITLINHGQLDSLIHNTATAKFFKIKTTGHATRCPKSSLGVGTHQLAIGAGPDTEADVFSGDYLEITHLTGVHSGANAISGDFSFGASGCLMRDRNRIQSVRGITVAGNFYELLNNIHSIGDKQDWNWQKTMLAPKVRFADLAISG